MRFDGSWSRASIKHGWPEVGYFDSKNYFSIIFNLFFCYNFTFEFGREAFPPNEYAIELRQTQASKWAFKSVAEGIEHFKSNRHTEAFQCLNKALTVDPRNVEGLVARGAL